MARVIQVKYLPQTETRPPRYKAFTVGHSVTLPYNLSEFSYPVIVDSVKRLCAQLEWTDGKWIHGGSLENGDSIFIDISLELQKGN